MKFLLDQDVYAAKKNFIKKLDHDAVPVAQIGLSRADDSELLKTALKQDIYKLGVRNHESEVPNIRDISKRYSSSYRNP